MELVLIRGGADGGPLHLVILLLLPGPQGGIILPPGGVCRLGGLVPRLLGGSQGIGGLGGIIPGGGVVRLLLGLGDGILLGLLGGSQSLVGLVPLLLGGGQGALGGSDGTDILRQGVLQGLPVRRVLL